MATRFRDLTIGNYLKLMWPFLVALLLGIVVRAKATSLPLLWRLPTDTTQGLGDAFIVAGIVGIGLEVFATKFLIEKVASDLSERLVGRGLPSGLQAHIRNIVETFRSR